MDISAYFYLAGDEARKDLAKWYNNEVIPHKVFREFIKKYECQDKAKNLSNLYSDLSKYTHRTYSAITKSYLLGRNNKIACDGFSEAGFRVLPTRYIPFVCNNRSIDKKICHDCRNTASKLIQPKFAIFGRHHWSERQYRDALPKARSGAQKCSIAFDLRLDED
ncbi:hypothetical protein P4133_03845 [Pseudomonas aeruginosa]|nr:hypothetical protein [Pseudomonas aeruginosa]